MKRVLQIAMSAALLLLLVLPASTAGAAPTLRASIHRFAATFAKTIDATPASKRPIRKCKRNSRRLLCQLVNDDNHPEGWFEIGNPNFAIETNWARYFTWARARYLRSGCVQVQTVRVTVTTGRRYC